jgi:hypothetical protein
VVATTKKREAEGCVHEIGGCVLEGCYWMLGKGLMPVLREERQCLWSGGFQFKLERWDLC